jgi:ribonuclease HI
MKRYTCYVDGSYISTIETTLGFSTIIVLDNVVKYIFADNFTSTKKLNSSLAEVLGLLHLLKQINEINKKNTIFSIFSDSEYACNAYNLIIKINSYKDTWKEIYKLKKQNIQVIWIKGKTNRFHNLCDSMAKMTCYDNLKIHYINKD